MECCSKTCFLEFTSGSPGLTGNGVRTRGSDTPFHTLKIAVLSLLILGVLILG